jgi:hypothetical protein
MSCLVISRGVGMSLVAGPWIVTSVRHGHVVWRAGDMVLSMRAMDNSFAFSFNAGRVPAELSAPGCDARLCCTSNARGAPRWVHVQVPMPPPVIHPTKPW